MEVLMKKNGLKLGFCWLPFYGKPKKIDAFSKIHHWLVVDLPLWKIWKSVGMIIPNISKNEKCSKPPTRSLGDCGTWPLHVATSAFKSSRSGLETSWQPGLPPKVPRRLWPCYASVHNANAMAGSTDFNWHLNTKSGFLYAIVCQYRIYTKLCSAIWVWFPVF